jgi:glutathione S-transferase
MQLYGGTTSNNVRRVRVVAAELGVTLEQMKLDAVQGETRQPAYLALNPMGKVPTLVDDGFVLWESPAIAWYLSTRADGKRLLGDDARAQADTLRWMFFGASHLDPYIGIYIVERFVKARRNQPPEQKLLEHADTQLARFLPIVEQQLAGREYLTGSFGLADICIGCTLAIATPLGHPLDAYPNITSWLARITARDSWKAAVAAQH